MKKRGENVHRPPKNERNLNLRENGIAFQLCSKNRTKSEERLLTKGYVPFEHLIIIIATSL